MFVVKWFFFVFCLGFIIRWRLVLDLRVIFLRLFFRSFVRWFLFWVFRFLGVVGVCGVCLYMYIGVWCVWRGGKLRFERFF